MFEDGEMIVYLEASHALRSGCSLRLFGFLGPAAADLRRMIGAALAGRRPARGGFR
jgi:hypothetical protein